jgi:glyoxylase-like metal-dependent hydrolase (beta-lactamase superfamily II)/rhodanese-related sulfurtransferase
MTARDITADELASRLGAADEPLVLDVRDPSEVAEWAIPGALSIPAPELGTRTQELPRDREIVVVCASGARSARAADLLSQRGFHVANLGGGMAAWGGVYDHVVIDLDDGVRVVQVRRRGKGCLSYVVGAGRDAFVVDPSLDVDVYLEVAAEHGWQIRRVFDTHLHADHVSGARALAAATGATLHLNPADTFEYPYEPLRDGESYSLGGDTAFSVAALRTPGHTEGSTVYFVDDHVALTGDTLFVDGVGRPDLAERAEEFARNLFRSLHERVLTLPDDALVLPGHYGDDVRVRPDTPVGATLGELRERLAPLSFDEDAFVRWATERATPRPPNYVEIITVNMGRSDLPRDALARLEAGPNRCSV